MGTQVGAVGTVGRATRAKQKTGTGTASHKSGKVRADCTSGAASGDMHEQHENSIIHSVVEARDSTWWTQSDVSQPERDLHIFMVTDSSGQSQDCEMHRESDHNEEWL